MCRFFYIYFFYIKIMFLLPAICAATLPLQRIFPFISGRWMLLCRKCIMDEESPYAAIQHTTFGVLAGVSVL